MSKQTDLYYPPFRWNIQRRNELGGLLDGPLAPFYSGFLDDLLPCCARILGFAGDSDLYFVGRSPESLFDHLSGLLLESSWADRLRLLHFSMRWTSEAEIHEKYPAAIEGLRAYLRWLKLSPEALCARARPVALIDLVARGQTFGNLIALLHGWAKETAVDWEAVKSKLRIVGITYRQPTSPKTWRWQQHAEWVPLLGQRAIKNVSIPGWMWHYLGNLQEKVTESYTPWRWASEAPESPDRSDTHLQALRLAVSLFDAGRTRERRLAFARALSQERAMRYSWFRALARDVGN